MSVKVVLPNAFQKHTNGTREIQSSAANLPQLITEIETSFPALKPHLRDNDGKLRRFINFYVNEEDIRFLGNDEYAFKDGDEVLVIPSIAGGSFCFTAQATHRIDKSSTCIACQASPLPPPSSESYP
jgi:molybdopterin synthase sulfur carrier subunit